MWILHNKVNSRLKKPLFGETWIDSVYRRKIERSVWAHLFAIATNYTTRLSLDQRTTAIYKQLITYSLPWMLKETELGQYFLYAQNEYDLVRYLKEKRLFEWVYRVRDYCHQHTDSPEQHLWTLPEIETFFSAFKAKNKGCSSAGPIPKTDKVHKGCT